jgi:hypothetical protein
VEKRHRLPYGRGSETRTELPCRAAVPSRRAEPPYRAALPSRFTEPPCRAATVREPVLFGGVVDFHAADLEAGGNQDGG